MNNEMPDEIYVQLGENRIGTEICLIKWSEKPFEDGTKYVRADKAAPEGFVLVPIEPTEDMLEAYKEADGDHSDWETWLEWDGGDATRLYKAMLSATPQPEQSDLLKDIHDAADVQAALNALFRLENDAISSRDGYGYSGGDAEIIRKIIMGYAELKENKAALTARHPLGENSVPDSDTFPIEVWLAKGEHSKPLYQVEHTKFSKTKYVRADYAALTAQDVNAELLEALKDLQEKTISMISHVNIGGDIVVNFKPCIDRVNKAISRAEQKGGE